MRPSFVKLLSVFLISYLGILVYSNTFSVPFQFDDNSFILNNFAIRHVKNLLNIWQYYPCRFFTFLSFAFNYHIFQYQVFGYHLFNLMVHVLSAILVWWLTLLTLDTPAMKENKITPHGSIVALFAGLVFVSHPLQTEAVTYIWQRGASMATMFYLASLCFYVKSRLAPRAGSCASPYYILSLIFAVMAMLTKEMAISLPLLILFYEISFLKNQESLKWKILIPFLFTLFIIPSTIFFTQSVHQKLPAEHISSMQYFLTQMRVMVTYIRMIFLPIHQNLDYDYPVFKSIFQFPVFMSSLFLISIFISAKYLFSTYRIVSFFIFWFFLTLLPESSFLPFKDLIFEHRLYLPLVGYSIFLVCGVYYLFGKNSIKTMILVLSMVIAFNSVLTYQRNKVWESSFSLWDDTVRKSPHKARPYGNRGVIYAEDGNSTKAMYDFNNAIEIDPKYAQAYNNRGILYYGKDDLTQAVSDYDKAIELDPKLADAYVNRGNVYVRENNVTQAVLDYTKAIELNPQHMLAYYNLAILYYQLKQYSQAWGSVHQAEKSGVRLEARFLRALRRVSGQDN